MKYKNKLLRLELAKRWWDAQPERFKAATTRPGSINQRVFVGKVK